MDTGKLTTKNSEYIVTGEQALTLDEQNQVKSNLNISESEVVTVANSSSLTTLEDNKMYEVTNVATTFNITSTSGTSSIRFIAGANTQFTLPANQGWMNSSPVFEPELLYEVMSDRGNWYFLGGRVV